MLRDRAGPRPQRLPAKTTTPVPAGPRGLKTPPSRPLWALPWEPAGPREERWEQVQSPATHRLPRVGRCHPSPTSSEETGRRGLFEQQMHSGRVAPQDCSPGFRGRGRGAAVEGGVTGGGASCLPGGRGHKPPRPGRPQALRSRAVCFQKPRFEVLLISKNWSPLFSRFIRLRRANGREASPPHVFMTQGFEAAWSGCAT